MYLISASCKVDHVARAVTPDRGAAAAGDGGEREKIKAYSTSQKKEVKILDPRTMPNEERTRRGELLLKAAAIDVAQGQIVATKELSARKAAEKWWDENVVEPAFYDTEVGEVEINKNSIESSLAHQYGQMKLDAITSLIDGFENAVYLGSMPDFSRQEGVSNHFFAYLIMYNGKRCYVFCRAMEDANKNRLYVHEVFVSDRIKKGDTLQTAASQPHGGIALYRDILTNVLEKAVKTDTDLPDSRLFGRKDSGSAPDKQGGGKESSEEPGERGRFATAGASGQGQKDSLPADRWQGTADEAPMEGLRDAERTRLFDNLVEIFSSGVRRKAGGQMQDLFSGKDYDYSPEDFMREAVEELTSGSLVKVREMLPSMHAYLKERLDKTLASRLKGREASDGEDKPSPRSDHDGTGEQEGGKESSGQHSENKGEQTIQTAVEAASAQVDTEPVPAHAKADELSYSITPDKYTTKRSRQLDTWLVNFNRDFSKEEWSAITAKAKALRGWYASESQERPALLLRLLRCNEGGAARHIRRDEGARSGDAGAQRGTGARGGCATSREPESRPCKRLRNGLRRILWEYTLQLTAVVRNLSIQSQMMPSRSMCRGRLPAKART